MVYRHSIVYIHGIGKVQQIIFTLEQAMKAQRGLEV
jgi:hypothetical protein